MKEASIIDSSRFNKFKHVQFLLQNDTSPCITIMHSSHKIRATFFSQIIKQFNHFGSSSPVHRDISNNSTTLPWLPFQNEVSLKQKHISYIVAVTQVEACKNSSSFFRCSFSKGWPIPEGNWVYAHDSFLFPQLWQKGHYLGSSNLSSVSLSTTVSTVLARSYTKRFVSWRVLFVSLE